MSEILWDNVELDVQEMGNVSHVRPKLVVGRAEEFVGLIRANGSHLKIVMGAYISQRSRFAVLMGKTETIVLYIRDTRAFTV